MFENGALLTTIGIGVFDKCTYLQTVYLPDSTVKYGTDVQQCNMPDSCVKRGVLQ